MHGIAEYIRIMNDFNAHLVQHLATNNLPPAIALVHEEADQSRISRRLGDRDYQSS